MKNCGLCNNVVINFPSYQIELALYADDTAIIAISRQSVLLVSYLESSLSDLER